MPHIIYIFFLGIASGLRALTGLAVMCWLAWAGLMPVHGWAHGSASIATAAVLTVLALAEDARSVWMAMAGRAIVEPLRLPPGAWAWRLLCAGLLGAAGAGCVYQPAAGGVVAAWAGAAAGVWLRPRLGRALVRLVGPGALPSLLESLAALWLAFAWAVQLAQTSRALLRAPFI